MKPLPFYIEAPKFCRTDIPDIDAFAAKVCADATKLFAQWPKDRRPPVVRWIANPDLNCARLGRDGFVILQESEEIDLTLEKVASSLLREYTIEDIKNGEYMGAPSKEELIAFLKRELI